MPTPTTPTPEERVAQLEAAVIALASTHLSAEPDKPPRKVVLPKAGRRFGLAADDTQVFVGDTDGHPFRGNQYTGGGGGEDRPTRGGPSAKDRANAKQQSTARLEDEVERFDRMARGRGLSPNEGRRFEAYEDELKARRDNTVATDKGGRIHKADAAARMYGEGSPQHKEAIERFGDPAAEAVAKGAQG